MTQAEIYMMQGLVVFGFAVFVMFYLIRLRSKFQKEAIDHVVCEFITPEGTGYTKKLPVIDGMVDIPPSKDVPKGATYILADMDTWTVSYPEGWIPNFLKCTIKKATLWEDSYLSAVTRDPERTDLNPHILYNIKREKVTEAAAEKSQAEANGVIGRTRQMSLPASIYVLLGLDGLITVGIGIFLFINWPELVSMVERLMQALGV